ncbi:aldo/keto reductase [Pseudorhizobium flavum]|uniref:Putative oxidoreductase n=1 Tax=Pseudorhizobium flavum TaxID=1335061 RepID=A0A7W9YXX6_9HYPH|nr:aldo/keto reductase [Pseudorhizobium flavum]MBB6180292.1 putative oxidoreductase [Pseudorhizobium flavum]CAD6618109.1 oxidoreductase [Pseudorhizobium flavum]
MERITLSPELEVSRIVYGMWRLGDDPETSPAHVIAKVEACLEQGITTMDQADIYGGYQAEAILGAALKTAPGLRDRIEIVSKCGIIGPFGRHAAARVKHYDTSADHINASVEASLRDLATDYLDLFLLHRPDPLLDPDETGAALDALVQSGKVRAVGVSNFRPWDFSLLQSSMESTLITNQIEMSLLAAEAFTNGDLAFLYERTIPVMAWSPLGGGALLAGRNPELLAALQRIGSEQEVEPGAVAVAWLLRHPAKILPILGTNNPQRIGSLAEASRVVLDRQTWFELYSLALGREVP